MKEKQVVCIITLVVLLCSPSSIATIQGTVSQQQEQPQANEASDCGCGTNELTTEEGSYPYRTGLLPGGPALPERQVFTGETPPSWD